MEQQIACPDCAGHRSEPDTAGQEIVELRSRSRSRSTRLLRDADDRARRAAVEQVDRAALVDVADQLLVQAIADQGAQLGRERPGQLARDAELLVLLLAQPAGAVVHRDAEPALAG